MLEWRDEIDLKYQIFVVFYVWPKKTFSYLLKSFISLSIWNDFMLLIWRYLPHELPLKKNPPRNLSICPFDSWPKVKVYKKNHIQVPSFWQNQNFLGKITSHGSLEPSQIPSFHWNPKVFWELNTITIFIFRNPYVGFLGVILSLKEMVYMNTPEFLKSFKAPRIFWNVFESFGINQNLLGTLSFCCCCCVADTTY